MKLGIFGGSFNPPHIGHFHLALAAAEALSLERILIIPAAVPPHKPAPDLAPAQDRMELCRRTFTDPRFTVSDIEIKRGSRSYTVDTLHELRRQYPQDELFLIVGSDMLAGFKAWRSWEEILRLCTLCAASREEGVGEELLRGFSAQERSRIVFISADIVEMSSTEIRRRLSQGVGAGEFLSPGAAEYIEQRGLYR